MGKRPRWSPEEKVFFQECVDEGMTDAQISSAFHVKTKFEKAKGFHMRTPDAMGRRRRFLELEQPPTEGKPSNHKKTWSQEDDDSLLLHKDLGLEPTELAVMFNRTELAINTRLKYLESKNEKKTLYQVFRKFSNLGNSISKAIFGSKNKEEGK